MIDKLKSWGLGILAFLAPIMGLLAYIFSQREENNKLKDTIAVSKAKEQLGKVLDEKEKATVAANSSMSEYERIRDEYLRGADQVSRGDQGSGPGASEQRPANSAVGLGTQTVDPTDGKSG